MKTTVLTRTPARAKVKRTSVASIRREAVLRAVIAVYLLASLPAAYGQGSRKDDIVFGPEGRPVAGATVRVCQPTATGTPCSPLATTYTDVTLTVPAANPVQTDGLGNYHFYAPPGRYQIQISSPQINGPITQSDVILPPDVSSSGAGNNISAFDLTLGGDLSVAGNATITGTLSTGNFTTGALSPSSLNVTGDSTVAGPRPYIDITSPQYGATGDGGSESTTGSITSGSRLLTVASTTGFKVGMGIHVDGAGASGDVLLATITAINGSVLTLSTPAGTTVASAGAQDDDTLAIRAAITAYCASPGLANGGSLYFPPGTYIVSQYQSVNSSGIPFNIPCAGIHLLGGNSGAHNGTPFVQPPTVSLLAHCGASPNAEPMFWTNYPYGNLTFQNLVIAGCNIAVTVGAANVVRFWNAYLSAGGGQTNGSALWVSDTFWVYFDYGGLTTSSTSVPTLLMTGDSCTGCYAGVGNVYMSNAILAGGQISYIQRGNATGEPSGHWVFRNNTQESGNGDLLSITNPGAFAFPSVGPITMDDMQEADNTSNSAALINLNSPGTTLSGVYINNSFSGAGGVAAPAIKITAGSLDHYFITGCDAGCVSQVWNSSGNPMGSGMTQSTGGLDSAVDVTNAERLITAPLSNNNQDGTGPSARFFQSGSPFASFGIDPSNGWMFGSSTQAGWNAQIYQATAPNIDIAFAANYPPTSVAATVTTTGGTIGTGTYYVWVVSTTASSCSSNSSMSAGSNIYGPLTVGSGVTTAEFNVSWAAAAAGATAIQGYCVFVDTRNQYSKFSPSSAFISGAGTTTATVGSFPNTPTAFPITYQMVQTDHLTPAYAQFNGAATPNAAGSPPYTALCVTTVVCAEYLQLSPLTGDSFTRANSSSLGANWSNTVSGPGLSPMAISSNSATETGSSAALQSWLGQTFLADQFSKATINSFSDGAGDLAGISVRGTGTNVDTSYTFHCYNGSSVITKRVTGTVTNLATGGANCAAGNTVELDAVGGSPTYLTGLINGSVALTATDASSPITSGAPGIFLWSSSDSLTNWMGGSLLPGNGTRSVFNQPNMWTQPQIFASPITSASLAVPNKTRTCNIVRGDQSGSALTTGNIQPQGSLCYVDAAATMTQVIVMVDAGASTVQVGYRHNGSTAAISPALTPASVSGVTDHVACANGGGTAITVEGNSVTCSTLSNSALTSGDFIETIGGTADGTSKRMSVALTYSIN